LSDPREHENGATQQIVEEANNQIPETAQGAYFARRTVGSLCVARILGLGNWIKSFRSEVMAAQVKTDLGMYDLEKVFSPIPF
jgi:hypothetical protein